MFYHHYRDLGKWGGGEVGRWGKWPQGVGDCCGHLIDFPLCHDLPHSSHVALSLLGLRPD